MKLFPPPASMAAFWQTLTKAGLVQGKMPTDPEERLDEPSPWFVKLMLGIAAWLSSLLFLLFIGIWLGSLFREESVRAVLGIAACALAGWHFSRNASSVFVSQIFFIMALLGQALVLSAIFDWFDTSNWAWLLTALFEIAALVAINHRPHRFLCALAALFCLRQILLLHAASGLFMPMCLAAAAWTLHQQWRKPRLWPAVALALCLAPFLIAIIIGNSWGASWLYHGRGEGSEFLLNVPFWVSRALVIIVWLGIVYVLLKEVTSEPISPKNAGVWLLAIFLAAGTWLTPLALSALTILTLGFSQRDRLLEGIGITQLLWSVGHYYYALQDTLLFKSLSLFALGCLLLLLYTFNRYFLPKEHAVEKSP